jgi:hypothetical protein
MRKTSKKRQAYVKNPRSFTGEAILRRALDWRLAFGVTENTMQIHYWLKGVRHTSP